MSRINPALPPYSLSIQTYLDKLMPKNMEPLYLFRVLARDERLFARFMSAGLLDRGHLSMREREVVILRVCANEHSEYEWGVHVAAFGSKAQWTKEQLHSSIYGGVEDACWDTEDQLIIRLSDQLHKTARVDDALWAELSAHFTEEQLVELIMLAGLYHAVSFMVNAIGVQHEAFAPRFPSNA